MMTRGWNVLGVLGIGAAALAMAGLAAQPGSRMRDYAAAGVVVSAGAYGGATVDRAEGGFATAETEREPSVPGRAGGVGGGGGVGGVRVVPLRVDVSVDDFREWIGDFLAGSDKEVDVTVARPDPRGESKGLARTMQGARLAALEMGPLDGGSKDPARLTLEIQAREVHWGKGEAAAPPSGKKAKAALSSNFSLELSGGLPSRTAAKIETVSIRRGDAAERTGLGRKRESGALLPSELAFTIGAQDVEPYLAWLEDALYKGRADLRPTATLSLLDASMKEPLLQLRASGLAIKSVEPEGEGAAERVGRFTVRCAVDRWELTTPKK